MKPKIPNTPPSIPTKLQLNLKIQSQNINTIKQQQLDHFLKQLEEPQIATKFTEQVPPFPQSFPKKQKIIIQTLPEFLKQQYTPPFNGAQAIQEEMIDPQPYRQDLVIQKIQPKQTVNDTINHVSQSNTIVTIQDIQDQLSQQHQQYIQEFCENLEQENRLKEVKDFIKLPLPELLRVSKNIPMPIKDKFRAMSAKERKQVVQQHEVERDKQKNKIKKMTLEEMEQEQKQKKQDYFKIIRELDMLNKGSRQLKNATSQQYGIRKQVDPPNVDKLLKAVKDTVWYSGEVIDKFEREMAFIRHKNSLQTDLIGINEINQIILKQEQKQNLDNDSEKINESMKIENEKMQNSEKKVNKNDEEPSFSSKNTQSSQTQKIILSTKAKLMQQLIDDDNDLF